MKKAGIYVNAGMTVNVISPHLCPHRRGRHRNIQQKGDKGETRLNLLRSGGTHLLEKCLDLFTCFFFIQLIFVVQIQAPPI